MKTILSLFCLIVLIMSCKTRKEALHSTYTNIEKNAPYDVIIVPGYPHESETWGVVVKMRVVWAKYLYDNGFTKNIIFSGSAVYTPYIESLIMKKYAEMMGIPSEVISCETKAEHTTENVYYSYRMAKSMGFKKIALATDQYQAKYIRRFIKKNGIPVDYLTVNMDTLMTLDRPDLKMTNPSFALKENFVSLTERKTLYHRIRGTKGKNIRWEEEDLHSKRMKRRHKKDIAKKL